jgi:hypothetical protein
MRRRTDAACQLCSRLELFLDLTTEAEGVLAFARAWRGAKSASEAAERLGVSVKFAQWAYLRLRRLGVPLRRLPAWGEEVRSAWAWPERP